MRVVTSVLILVLTAGFLGCGGGGDAAYSDAVSDAARSILDPGSHVWTTADGVAMPYDIGGNADAAITVVFVHCWMCHSGFWDAQLPVAGERFRTVNLDLPGHGEAGTNRESWTVAGYGEDVAGLIGYLGLEDVILVGHSMGGPVSLRAAAMLPGKVRGIVAVDTLADAEIRYDGEQFAGIMAAFESDFVATCEGMIGQMVPEEGAEAVAEQVKASGCNGGRAEVGIALMKDFGAIDLASWFQQAGVPIRAVNATDGMPTRTESNRNYADYDAVLMDGVGHYLHMTRPEEFNAHMMRWIDEFAGTETATPAS